MSNLRYSAEIIWGLKPFASILPAVTKKALRNEQLLRINRRSTVKISTYTLNTKHLLLLGDFNLWANSSQDPVADACFDHLEGLGLQQLVCGPAHASGHTLDLIFRQDLEINIREKMSRDHGQINTPLNSQLP